MFVFSPAHADLNTGLVANYSFDDCTAKDNSGNGHDGTINGNPQCVDGSKGKAFSFDGTSDYIDVPHSDSLNMNQSISFGGFIKLTELTGDISDDTIINKEGSPFELAIHDIQTASICVPDVIKKYNFTFYMDIQKQLTPCWVDGGKNVVKNTWSHLFVTYDNSEIKTYFDGKLVKTYKITGSIVNSTEAFRIAARGGNSSPWGFFNGVIDELRIYNRALSETEVKSLYNMGQLSGTVNGVQKYSAVCKNLKTGVSKKIPLADGAKEWNCKAAGLQTKKGENVSVTITGVSQ